MYREIKDRLLECTEQWHLHTRLRDRAEALRTELEQHEAELAERKKILASEDRDVEKLEGTSLTSLFVSLFGDREARLDKERREAARARLRAEQQQDQVESTREELERTHAQIEALGDVEGAYRQAFDDKRSSLAEGSPEIAERLEQLGKSIGTRKATLREIREANNAGDRARQHLAEIAKSLSDAKDMGTWDMLGGGTFVTLAKHGHLDSAKAHATHAQRWLQRFSRELADVGRAMQGDALELSDFATFADYFVDGILSDFFVQSKIDKSLQSVERTRQRLHTELQRLETLESDLRREVQSLEANYVALVRDA
ncbi:MAG: hypothetical protein AAF799_47130 [Myxococcota bacterium]